MSPLAGSYVTINRGLEDEGGYEEQISRLIEEGS
jgi:hypothetical protein